MSSTIALVGARTDVVHRLVESGIRLLGSNALGRSVGIDGLEDPYEVFFGGAAYRLVGRKVGSVSHDEDLLLSAQASAKKGLNGRSFSARNILHVAGRHGFHTRTIPQQQ